MTTATPLFGTLTAMTCTIASLASDTNLVAGRESTVVDNGSGGTDAFDIIISGKITTGTSPTAARQIEIWAYSVADTATTYMGSASGADANLTPDEKTNMVLLKVIPTSSTSNVTYRFGGISLAAAFGGVVPQKFGLFVVHNTGVVLHATGSNHVLAYTAFKAEAA